MVEEVDVYKFLNFDVRGGDILYYGREEGEAWLGSVHHLQYSNQPWFFFRESCGGGNFGGEGFNIAHVPKGE